jgi:trimeric autotransporter adhesin
MKSIFTTAFCFLFLFASAQTWSDLGSGINGKVYATAIFQGQLYAGGTFSNAGGNPAANIARWDGANWNPLAAGTNNTVFAMAEYHNQLYVAGSFTQVDGSSVKRIARWDGTNWDTVSKGINGFAVYALTVHDGNLYAAGKFGQAGNASVWNIAMWNDSIWTDVGGGITGYWGVTEVLALASWNGKLFAGGNFQIGGTDSLCINMAQWDGNSWAHLDTDGLDDKVRVITPYGNELLIGGDFLGTWAALQLKHLARWDGNVYTPVQQGMNNSVNAMFVYGSDIYIGGKFTRVNNTNMEHVAIWNGSAFTAMGGGIDTTVLCITADDGIVFAGGEFTNADGVPASRIAKWSAAGVGMEENTSSAFSIYPNPSNGIFNFQSEENGVLEIYNAQGQLVRMDFIRPDLFAIDISEEAKGIYSWKFSATTISYGKLIVW